MWTRAAVARRNINICEMPSHDDYLGAGRRAGCGARVPCEYVPFFSASVLGWSLLGSGCVGVVCPRSGSFLVVHGCPWQGSVGFEGQVLRSSLNMVNRVPVVLCLACYREWGRGLHV